MNADFIEIDFEGEGKTKVSIKALTVKTVAKEEIIKKQIIEGKIGNVKQKPLNRRRN